MACEWRAGSLTWTCISYVGSIDMAEHRFRVGDLVRVRASAAVSASLGVQRTAAIVDGLARSRTDGLHEVTRLLPELSDGEPQYRIKGCNGRPERVVRESELTPAAYSAQPRR
jgi:hypothetical protein